MSCPRRLPFLTLAILASSQAQDELGRFTILSARFDAARAEQLVGLQDWYFQQEQLFAGNADALDAAHAIFEQKWDAIVTGTTAGVNATLDQLAKLRQGILDYVDKLKTGNLSPLTPTQKLAEAQGQFTSLLSSAQGGNTDAFGKITQASDALLQIAQQFYGGSTKQFRDIFSNVTGKLTTLGTPPAVTTPAATTADAFASALPKGSTIASEAGLEKLGRTILDALGDHATVVESGSADVVDQLKATTREIALNGSRLRLKT